ncbi:MAG: alginate lyase family protein [Planctomycetota bacterium]
MFGPSLYLSEDELQRARCRVSEPAWAGAAEALRRAADERLAEPLQWPSGDTSWYDDAPDRDYGETYGAFHDYAVPFMKLAGGAEGLIRAARVLEHPPYAEAALRRMNHLVDHVGFHVRHHDRGLVFAKIVNGFAEAYRAFRPRLSADRDARWRAQLTAAGEGIRESREHWRTVLAHMPYNNHLAHHQAALLKLGLVLERDDWIDTALNGRGSFAYLLAGCVTDDGLCYESSTGYHFATLGGLMATAELVRHHPHLGRDLYHETFANGRCLKQMFDAPLGLMLPNGELPPLGDCYANRRPLWQRAEVYEIAYAIYGDPRYAWLLDRRGPRDTAPALLYGADDLGAPAAPAAQSRVWIEHGYALLTSRDGDDYWNLDDGGPTVAVLTGDVSGVHHHRDSLSLQVVADGCLWTEDVESRPTATNGFSDPIQAAFNRTAWAHNTVVVDERDQGRTPRPLPVIEWRDLPGWKAVAMADPDGCLAPGVRMIRSAAVTDAYCLDVFQLASDTEHTYDWLVHPRADGPAGCDLDWTPIALAGRPAFECLSDPVAAPMPAEGASLTWSQDGRAFRADVSAGRAGEAIRAGWPVVGDGTGGTREMFMVRVRAARAEIAALYQPLRPGRRWRLQSCRRHFSGEFNEVRVDLTDGTATHEHVFKAL